MGPSSGRCEKEKNLALPGIEHIVIDIQTELSRLHFLHVREEILTNFYMIL
jgi:hypothetical protein